MANTKQPYEFLARWTDGKLAGAHVGFITVVTDDVTGEVMGKIVGDVMPVDVGSGKGYPLKDIMSQLHIDALVEVDALKAEKVALEASIAEVAQKQAELDAAKEVPAQ